MLFIQATHVAVDGLIIDVALAELDIFIHCFAVNRMFDPSKLGSSYS